MNTENQQHIFDTHVINALIETLQSDKVDIESEIEKWNNVLKKCDNETHDLQKYIEAQSMIQFYSGMLTENQAVMKAVDHIKNMEIGDILKWIINEQRGAGDV